MPRQGKCCCRCTQWCDVCINRRFKLDTVDLQASLGTLTASGECDCSVWEGPHPLVYNAFACSAVLPDGGGPPPPADQTWAEFFGVDSIEWLQYTDPPRRACPIRGCCWGTEIFENWCEAGLVNIYIYMTFVIVDGTKLGVFGHVTSSGFATGPFPTLAGLLVVSPTSKRFDCNAPWNFAIPLSEMAPGSGPHECSTPTTLTITSI